MTFHCLWHATNVELHLFLTPVISGATPGTYQDGCIEFLGVKKWRFTHKIEKCTWYFVQKSSFSLLTRTTFRTILHQDECIAPVAWNLRVQMHPLYPYCRRLWISSGTYLVRDYKLQLKWFSPKWNEWKLSIRSENRRVHFPVAQNWWVRLHILHPL